MCGVIGTFEVPDPFEATFDGMHMVQHRGTEGAGVVFSDGQDFVQPAPHRTLGPVADCLGSWPGERPERIVSSVGQLRYGTSGTHSVSTLENLQPLVVDTRLGKFSIGHNGDVPGHEDVRTRLQAGGMSFVTSSDTEVIANVIGSESGGSLQEAMLRGLSGIRGAFSLVMTTPRALVAARDPWGYRPLLLAKLGGGHVVASETCVFDMLQAELVREIEPGELVWIDGDRGVQSLRFAEPQAKTQQCPFELIYFSRPDCWTYGIAVDEFRERLGQQLAREYGPSKLPQDAVVAGVPDSAILIAEGYAKALGKAAETILIRHHYSSRTFIQPGQAARDNGVRLKFNTIRRRVEGRTIVLVDDSLVRGTTMRRLIRMLKRNGAARVIVLIASPPISHPCRYGIDMKTREELRAAIHGGDVEAIRDSIEADDLHYLSLEGLRSVVGDHQDFCFACFDGKYAI